MALRTLTLPYLVFDLIVSQQTVSLGWRWQRSERATTHTRSCRGTAGARSAHGGRRIWGSRHSMTLVARNNAAGETVTPIASRRPLVHYEIELCWPLNGQIPWLGALQNLNQVRRSIEAHAREIWPIGSTPTRIRETGVAENLRNAMRGCKLNDFDPVGIEPEHPAEG